MADRLKWTGLERLFERAVAAAPARAIPRGRHAPAQAARMYAGARTSRLTGDWYAPENSADAELVSSLRNLRARSRQLLRDSSYAKRARNVVVNNVVGTGIRMQAQVKNARGKLVTDVNSSIEDAWCEWSRPETCHTGGRLHFADLERMAMGQVFEAGEVLLREYYRPFGGSAIPYALEVVESERVAEEYRAVPGVLIGELRMGIEQDEFGRPLKFWLRRQHPGDYRPTLGPERLVGVPAEEIIHLAAVDRWPQSRGEPWLHAAMRRINDMDGYSEAEIVAARAAAAYMGFLETPEGENPTLGTSDDDVDDGMVEFDLEPGAVRRLAPGEKFTMHAPNRPNPNMDPFLRVMLREVAAGTGVSYESISRDYSRSNYSSSRLALLEDRDTWRVLQMWFIRAFRQRVHRSWLQQAVLARAIPRIDLQEYYANPVKFQAVAFRPRGWSWVDPTKEVAAYKEAVKGGFITVADVIAQTANGKDLEDFIAERKAELELFAENGLAFDTDPGADAPPAAAAPAAPVPDDPAGDPAADDEEGATGAAGRVIPLRSNAS